jgi:hypothetical protein
VSSTLMSASATTASDAGGQYTELKTMGSGHTSHSRATSSHSRANSGVESLHLVNPHRREASQASATRDGAVSNANATAGRTNSRVSSVRATTNEMHSRESSRA